MQEEKFTSKKSLVQECTSKDFGDGTLVEFEAKVFQDGRWLHIKKKKKKKGEREQKEDKQPISEWSCET